MTGHFLADAQRTACRLVIERSGVALGPRLELATDSASRRRGLLGRHDLHHAFVLAIAPSQGVHTFGMAGAIDAIAVSRDGTVIRLRPNLPARRLFIVLSAFAIIELTRGACTRAQLRVGDRLRVDPLT